MRRRPAGRGAQRGTTLLELMFTLAMFGLLLGVVVRFVTGGRNGMTRQENTSEMLKRVTLISANLRGSLQTTSLLLCKYPVNTPDFSLLRGIITASVMASTGTPKPVSFTSEPTLMEVAAPDLGGPTSTAAANWGNELMYVASLNPVTMTVAYGVGANAPFEVAMVSRVQLVYIYLSQDPATKIPGPNYAAGGLRLTEWRSQPLIAYESINSFSDLTSLVPPYYRRTSACAGLVAMGYTKAIDVSKAYDPSIAFFAISNTGNVATCLPAIPAPGTLAQSSWAYVDDYTYQANYNVYALKNYGRIGREGAGGRASAPSTYAIAFNAGTASASAATRVNALMVPGSGLLGMPVPGYAQVDHGGSQVGFPGGFEITVVGKPHARVVMARVVLMAISGAYPKYGPFVYPALERHTTIAIDNDF